MKIKVLAIAFKLIIFSLLATGVFANDTTALDSSVSTAAANEEMSALGPILLEDGTFENTGCEISNPLLDNDYYKQLLGEITEKDHVYGPDNAIMTLIEYADFQCPGCADTYEQLKNYQEMHPDEVRVVFRHYPLATHELSMPAARFAEAAGQQGIFFEFGSFLFETQETWSCMSESAFEKWVLREIPARFPNIDIDQFQTDYGDEDLLQEIKNNALIAKQSGQIIVTPTIMINYSPFANSFSASEANSWLYLLRFNERLYTECPAFSIEASKTYKAVLETTKGVIEIDLYPKNAPLAVANFIRLAKDGWYDEMPISASVEGYAVQFGDPSATGYLNSGYVINSEKNMDEFPQANGYVTLFEDSSGKNSSIVLLWLDVYGHYLNIFSQDPEITDAEAEEYAESMAMNDVTGHTVIGKITENTYPVASSLEKSDVIETVSIIEVLKNEN